MSHHFPLTPMKPCPLQEAGQWGLMHLAKTAAGSVVVSPPKNLERLIRGNHDMIHTASSQNSSSGVHGEPTLHTYFGMDDLLPQGCVLWGSPASSTVPDPQSRLYMAGKAKTSSLISFDKTYELGVN